MKCRICKGEDLKILYSNKDQFLYTQGIVSTKDDPRLYAKYGLDYYFCKTCGFIFNPNPITSKNDVTYRKFYTLNPQDLSEKDSENLNNLVDLILQNIKLKKKNKILEIGSNDGYFLNLFHQKGYDCIGIDPSPAVEMSKKKYPYIKVMREYYNPKYFKQKFDLIICRNVIEHLENPIDFILSIKKSLKLRGFVYFEVPNVQKYLEKRLYTNFYQEHISYFHKNLFEIINSSLGFETKFLDIINYDDVIAYIGQNTTTIQKFKIKKLPDLGTLEKEVNGFKKFLNSFKTKIKKLFNEFIRNKLKIGIWGAGCTAINILSYLGEGDYQDCFLFDSSETKIGKYLPGFGKEIKSPHDINSVKPDVMIIMSERYINEIYYSLKQMQFSNDIWILYPDLKKLS